MDCPMCPMGEEDYRKDRDKRMDFDLFKKVKSGLALVKYLTLSFFLKISYRINFPQLTALIIYLLTINSQANMDT